MLVLSDFALSFSTRKFMRAIPRSTASVAEPTRQFCGRANARQILLATSIVLVAMASLLMQEPLLHAQVAAPRAVRPRRLNAKPLATGAQPGTANFSGNLTTITTSSSALALGRESDCTLTLETGNYSYTGSSITYSNTNQTSDYERVLHNEAQLTTTPDVFATPCIHQPIAGFGSRPAVFVGLTTSGVYVYAAIGAIAPSFINGVYLMTGATTLSISSFQFSTAGQSHRRRPRQRRQRRPCGSRQFACQQRSCHRFSGQRRWHSEKRRSIRNCRQLFSGRSHCRR